MDSGSRALPVFIDAVMRADAPTFTVATANGAAPVGPGTCTMPSFVKVAAKATMSGTGLVEAESSRVLMPARGATAVALLAEKVKAVSVGGKDAVGVIVSKKQAA